MVDAQTITDNERWAGVYNLLDRNSLIHPEFEPQEEVKEHSPPMHSLAADDQLFCHHKTLA